MKPYQKYQDLMQTIARWQHTAALLQWDMEVCLPEGAFQGRAAQIAQVNGMIQDLLASDSLYNLLQELASDSRLPERDSANVIVNLRDIRRKRKYSRDFVERVSLKTSLALDAWNQARKSGDSAIFLPHLDQLVKLKREEADIIGYEGHPYDALLDEYEPGMNTETLDALFAELIPELRGIMLRASENGIAGEKLKPGISKDELWECGIDILRIMGYDFNRGRQDISSHPFTISLGADDVRVTTRIPEDDPADMIWSCLHEGGHALYEQALGSGTYGFPESEAASLGIHESQSRLWENHIGRNHAFWEGALPHLRQKFPNLFMGMDSQSLLNQVNRIEPGFLRTQADEVSYHSHVQIRYEIEKELIAGNLQAADIPTEWNRMYAAQLGLNVPSDVQGFLQDIHWAHGSFGYFPTYSLGSLYAAQFYQFASQKISGLEDQIRNLEFKQLHTWLHQEIYRYGRTAVSEQICLSATGERLNPKYFIRYATEKFNS